MKLFLSTIALFCCSALYAQNIITVAGTGTSGYNGDFIPALAANLGPTAIAVDGFGNMFIADYYGKRIRKVVGGTITTVAGDGVDDYSGDGGDAVLARTTGPLSIHVDTLGNIYFTEWGRPVIRKISSAGVITRLAGLDAPGYNGDGIPAINASLSSPYGPVTDKELNVYFADAYNHRIRKIGINGLISTVAGTGTPGYSGNGGPATEAQINDPGMLAFSPAGDLYWPERGNHIIRKLSMATGIISTVAGTGSGGAGGDDWFANEAQLELPNSIAFNKAGDLFIADAENHNIRKVTTFGFIYRVAGTSFLADFAGDGGLAINALFNTPNCIATDNSGNLYINDALNYRVRRINYAAAGVNELQGSTATVIISPNPAIAEIHIASNSFIHTVHIVNLLGRVVLQHTPGSHHASLCIAHLPAATYMVKVNGVYAGRFVKE